MECKKCGLVWQEKKPNPKQCPGCHRYNYREPRKWKVDKIKQEPSINSPVQLDSAVVVAQTKAESRDAEEKKESW